MGLFTSSPPPPTNNPTTPAPAPNRQSRTSCYQARDLFFACLTAHNIIDAIKESPRAEAACGPEGRALERECVGSWVTYFKQRRVMEASKKETLERLEREGARPVGEGVEGRTGG